MDLFYQKEIGSGKQTDITGSTDFPTTCDFIQCAARLAQERKKKPPDLAHDLVLFLPPLSRATAPHKAQVYETNNQTINKPVPAENKCTRSIC